MPKTEIYCIDMEGTISKCAMYTLEPKQAMTNYLYQMIEGNWNTWTYKERAEIQCQPGINTPAGSMHYVDVDLVRYYTW